MMNEKGGKETRATKVGEHYIKKSTKKKEKKKKKKKKKNGI